MATMAARTQAQPLLSTFQKHIEDMRNLVLCKICIKPLYEPYILACGHTYCYSCLTSWFTGGANRPRRRNDKNCPDCRTAVIIQPAPNYLLRDLVHMFISRIELLEEHETTEEHLDGKNEEARVMAADKAGPGLFKGAFRTRHHPDYHGFPRHLFDVGPGPIHDPTDLVLRCPVCHWELEDGSCGQCLWPNHSDMSDGSSQDDSDSLVDTEDGETVDTQSVINANSDELEIDHDIDPVDHDLRELQENIVGFDDYYSSDADDDLPAAVTGGIHHRGQRATFQEDVAQARERGTFGNQNRSRQNIANQVRPQSQAALRREFSESIGRSPGGDLETETDSDSEMQSTNYDHSDMDENNAPDGVDGYQTEGTNSEQDSQTRNNIYYEDENEDYSNRHQSDSDTSFTRTESTTPVQRNHARHISISSGDESDQDDNRRSRLDEALAETSSSEDSSEEEINQTPVPQSRRSRQQRHVILDDSDEEDDEDEEDESAREAHYDPLSTHFSSQSDASVQHETAISHPVNYASSAQQTSENENDPYESDVTTIPPQTTANRRAHLNDQRARRGNTTGGQRMLGQASHTNSRPQSTERRGGHPIRNQGSRGRGSRQNPYTYGAAVMILDQPARTRHSNGSRSAFVAG